MVGMNQFEIESASPFLTLRANVVGCKDDEHMGMDSHVEVVRELLQTERKLFVPPQTRDI
jgi:hypothetical protein